MPRRVRRQRSRRHARASGLAVGWPKTERQRVLRANARNAKNKMFAVNFERSAAARHKEKSRAFFRLGFCHISAKRHNVSMENSVTAKSVWTRGAKAMKAGVLTYTLRQSSPAQSPPSFRAYPNTIQPRISATTSIGARAHARVVMGSFHFVRTHSPKTHSPRYAGKKVLLNVHEMCE